MPKDNRRKGTEEVILEDVRYSPDGELGLDQNLALAENIDSESSFTD